MDGFIQKARDFAIFAHNTAIQKDGSVGQFRKYSKTPYWHHPRAVVGILEAVGGFRKEVYAAAWLHDVVEDTLHTIKDIQDRFGPDVADLVWQVTDEEHPDILNENGKRIGPNRAARKAMDREKLAKSTYEGASIKLADLIHNTSDIEVNDPDFWKVYRAEKRLLLPLLKHGHATLWNRANDQVNS